ncbi:HVA22-like protein k [Nymphaea colorata]|nr:HVA22-like protein k [Nymphaea colorata]XP_031474314.1 HVA22-like protein k [Nymphaea colorata]XP_031474315.1 HVA22-like protein k [Nymphaea colorata]
MDFSRCVIPGEVGLRLLLSPLGSNIVTRTACCSIGVALPVYSTFKAIEKNDQKEKEKWLCYWAAFGSFSIAEIFTDKIISWFPLYYHMKFAFLVWLQLPGLDGSRHLYLRFIRPFLLKHQAKLDQLVGFIYGEMNKFVTSHQREIQFLRVTLHKSVFAVYQTVRGMIVPVRPCLPPSEETEDLDHD